MSCKKTVEDHESECVRMGDCLVHAVSVARKVYQLRHGPLPSGIYVCHTCDVGKCLNDDHHFPGTPADNMRDAKEKGRMKHSDEYKVHMAKVMRRLWRTAAYRSKLETIFKSEARPRRPRGCRSCP